MDKCNIIMYNCSIMDKLLSNLDINLQRAELSSLGAEWKNSYNGDSFARILKAFKLVESNSPGVCTIFRVVL